MLAVNIDFQDKLVNGQLGTVMHIEGNSQGISKIYLKFDDTRDGVKAMNADIIRKQNLWVPIEKTEVDIKIKLSKNSSPVIKRTQYPLMLAWSCTVHKVQGLSLNKIVVSFMIHVLCKNMKDGAWGVICQLNMFVILKTNH